MLVYRLFLLLMTILSSFQKVSAQCSGTATTNTVGYDIVTVSPPGYPSGYATNLNCAWVATSSIAGAVLLFRVTDITLSCAGDAVNVYDGTTSSGTQVHSNECQSGSGPRTLGYNSASTGNVYTEFSSDNTASASEKGFLMYIISGQDLSGTGCSATQALTATDTEQYLTSPNFPNLYSTATTCEWEVTSQSSPNVEIKILFVDIENDASCQYDYLDFQEQGSSVHQLCTEDSWTSTTYTSTGNSFTVKFVSDNQIAKRGFILSYKQTGTVQSSSSSSSSLLSSAEIAGITCAILAVCGVLIGILIALYLKFYKGNPKYKTEKQKNNRPPSRTATVSPRSHLDLL